MELRITGLRETNQRLRAILRGAGDAALQALREEAEVIMAEAKRRTPVDTGALRASGHVEAVPRRKEVRLTFGDAAVDYAAAVHERTEVRHVTGRSKFLESALVEALPSLPQRVARRMNALLRKL